MFKRFGFISLFCFVFFSLTTLSAENGASTVNPYRLHEKVGKLNNSAPPEFWEGNIFFTYRSTKRVRAVGIAFEHEKYGRIHYFQKNKNGIFFFAFPVPEKEYIAYRLIIDGIWMPDPMAPEVIYDNAHRAISRVTIGDFRKYVNKKTPFVSKDNGKTIFIIKERKGRQVFLAGDFNNWDPYMMPLKERPSSEPGISEYSIEISLPAGNYLYVYYVDGRKVLDPVNRRQSVNLFGEISSVYYASPR